VRFGAATRKLLWTFTGAAAATDAFGDPVAGVTGYALCAYDGAGGSIFAAGVGPGGTCGSTACWAALGGGAFRRRGGAAFADGLTRLVLKPASGDRTRIRVEGAGAALVLPELPVAELPVVVQLVRADDPTQCWQATFAAARRNDADGFRGVVP
jgi:hypothetical protein